MTVYIPRKLRANQSSPNERLVTEDELATLGGSLIILGDPGLGKTSLTESLEQRLGAKRVPAGTFYRSENLERFAVNLGVPLIIDGLDEITLPSGGSAVDEVLKKLSRIGSPKFILSCRSADCDGPS